jgi:uncharacterized phage-like protein YoqJ
MNRLTSAVFIGHRTCPHISEMLIEKFIEPLIKNGVITFYNGGMGDFDLTAARSVHYLKQFYPNIKNILVIPYPNFSVCEQELFDDIIYPFATGEINKSNYRSAIPKRNQYMVDCSAYVISYVTHYSRGAYQTLQYAKKQNLSIIEIK